MTSSLLGVSTERSSDVFGEGALALTRLPDIKDNRSFATVYSGSVNKAIRDHLGEYGGNRQIAVKAYYISRQIEVLARTLGINPESVVRTASKQQLVPEHCYSEIAISILSYLIGCIFNRWNISNAMEEMALPDGIDLLSPLPIYPPGAMTNGSGLPIDANILPEQNPLRVYIDGIMADDPGHPLDVEASVQHAMRVIWKDCWEDIEREACDILEVQSLRDYFRNQGCFFADHIKRYSKSRRKAPIYWQLSTPSSKYSIWLYYHRLTKDTFYQVYNDFVKPKLDYEERQLTQIRQEYGPDATAGQRKKIMEQETFVEELRSFRDEVVRVAPLLNPDLNDGVIINFAPLWRLVPQHRAWQKECKDCWDKLLAGDYDWAHLAMHLWPERVVPKCQSDRSLAIAHGLEETLWEQDEKGKWQPRDISRTQVEALIAERSSEAVKAALHNLLTAPMPGGQETRRRKK